MKVAIWALTRPQFEEAKTLARSLAQRHENVSFVCSSLDRFDASPSQMDRVDGAVILEGHEHSKSAIAAYEKMGASVATFRPEGDEPKEKKGRREKAPKPEPKEEPTPDEVRA